MKIHEYYMFVRNNAQLMIARGVPIMTVEKSIHKLILGTYKLRANKNYETFQEWRDVGNRLDAYCDALIDVSCWAPRDA